MHYKTRANVYMVLGGGVWLVAVLVSAIVRIWGGGGFHVLVNLLVALIFGYGMPNFCNFLITVLKRGFWFI
jgi:hypothetical protein